MALLSHSIAENESLAIARSKGDGKWILWLSIHIRREEWIW
jgi:hypothetical protein